MGVPTAASFGKLFINLGLYCLEQLTSGQLVKPFLVDMYRLRELELTVELSNERRIGISPN